MYGYWWCHMTSCEMTYFHWYPSAPASSLTYRCYVFASQRSEPWKELIQSLFTFKLGVLMTCSTWLVIFAVVQFVYNKPVWQMSVDMLVKAISVIVRIILVLLAYEFMVMKFPLYIREVVVSELCSTMSIASEEVSLFIPIWLKSDAPFIWYILQCLCFQA